MLRKINNQLIRKYIRSYCNYCNLYINCEQYNIKIDKKEIILKDKNPCIECKYYDNKNNKQLCKKIEKIDKRAKKYEIDIIICRLYKELCGPCGKFFERK